MSLADRFSRLKDHKTPDWVLDAEDDDSDLVQAARDSFAAAADGVTEYSQAPAPLVTCPECGDEGTYWEDRISVHDSIVGFEIRAAGIEHPDGRLCTEGGMPL